MLSACMSREQKIQGTWLEPNGMGMALREGGEAEALGMPGILYSQWMLRGDTSLNIKGYNRLDSVRYLPMDANMKINKLTSDSLVLSRRGIVIFRMARQK